MSITALERPQTRPAGPPARHLSLVQPAPIRARLPRHVDQRGTPEPTGNPEASAPTPARITRRGRLVLCLGIVTVFSAVALVAAWSVADRPPPPRPAAAIVVVQSGDTLWAVAARADPQVDPRVTVDRIVKLNGLSDATVQPGQRLRLPSH
ncbi:MAG: LysM peptidoglycan-binding domain-containing protein [Pseudonocardiales bacterium]